MNPVFAPKLRLISRHNRLRIPPDHLPVGSVVTFPKFDLSWIVVGHSGGSRRTYILESTHNKETHAAYQEDVLSGIRLGTITVSKPTWS